MSAPLPLVLIVDDNEIGRYAKVRVVRNAGFDVIEASTGAEARRLVAERNPELVLLDVKLPDANGRVLAAEIKANPGTATVMVLQTSASHIDTAHRVASLEAGADGYLVEPIEPEELVAHVRALLRMRKAEHDRQAALEALQEADRRKDEFLAMLAHELRNPLAPIRNAVEILRVSEDRGVRDRAREMVGRQVQHLARLVDDLLDVSRITQRKIVLKPTIVRLASVIEAAVEVARPVMDAQQHELAISLPPEEVWIKVDAVRMAQTVGNLLHNAAKFTPRGGRVELRAARDANELTIAVEDNGMGMTAEVMPKVFDLFAQGDRSLDRAQGGLGIGLSLVRGLVEMHGGTVEAQSAGHDQGSRFTLRLPWSKLAAQPAPPQGTSAAATRDGRRILVVEDNDDAAESMRLLLTAIGHEVTVVTDGLEAVATARRVKPEIVLLDIGLPGMNGFQLATTLRAMPETRRAHLIAVSGYGQEKDRAMSREAGFDVHLVKPVDPAKLTEAINAVPA